MNGRVELQSHLDRHFSVQELSELWSVSQSTILRMFQDEEGVLKLGNKSKNGHRSRIEIRIPESVAKRVHQKRRRSTVE
jgi:hypothetical protein